VNPTTGPEPRHDDGRPRHLGEYPVADGAITDVGRQQQVAVAAWVLGWLAGPVPALLALLVTRPGPGAYRRLLAAAAAFWVAVVVLAGLLLATTPVPTVRLWVGWAALSVVALVATALAVRRALRRIGAG
jgi:hypothetical protein